MNSVKIPPGTKIANCSVYDAINVLDSNDRFQITADSETGAKLMLIDKLGFALALHDSQWTIVDVDDDPATEPGMPLDATTAETALDEAVLYSGWKLGDPTELIT